MRSTNEIDPCIVEILDMASRKEFGWLEGRAIDLVGYVRDMEDKVAEQDALGGVSQVAARYGRGLWGRQQ